MAAPVGSVWLADKQRYRTEEEQTEGQMPENLWLIGFSVTVRAACRLIALRRRMGCDPTRVCVWQAFVRKARLAAGG